MKGMKGFWKKFDELMSGLDDAIEEEVADMRDNVQVNTSYGTSTSIANMNGNIVIKGHVKSLTVNGKKIELK